MVAPYSGDILAIVALSANDNSSIPSPEDTDNVRTSSNKYKRVTIESQVN